jgi:hypothetical protein
MTKCRPTSFEYVLLEQRVQLLHRCAVGRQLPFVVVRNEDDCHTRIV